MATLKEILTRRPVAATIRLTVPAGGARPAPPVGPALGQYRLNLMAFCKDFNARTQKYKPDTPMSVTITAFKDNTFEFTVKSPKVTWYLKKAAGVESGSTRPGHVVASTLSVRHVYEIAKLHSEDQQHWSLIWTYSYATYILQGDPPLDLILRDQSNCDLEQFTKEQISTCCVHFSSYVAREVSICTIQFFVEIFKW